MTDSELQQKRLIAAAIDVGVLVAASTLLSMSGLVIGCLASMTKIDFLASYGTKLVFVIVLFVDLMLVLGRDLTAGDRSLGKKLMNIRVVKTTGEPITFMDSAKRNALFAPGLAIGLVTSIFALIPLVGCIVWCLLLIPRGVAAIAALGAVAWEVMQIVENTQGVRAGDNLANTRVTW
jgi:uncharacterized RDD family membrane protein YckC